MPLFIVTCLLLSLFFVVVVFFTSPFLSFHPLFSSCFRYKFNLILFLLILARHHHHHYHFTATIPAFFLAPCVYHWFLLFAFRFRLPASAPHPHAETHSLVHSTHKQLNEKTGKKAAERKGSLPIPNRCHCISSYERIHRAVNISRTRSGEKTDLPIAFHVHVKRWLAHSRKHARTHVRARFPFSVKPCG